MYYFLLLLIIVIPVIFYLCFPHHDHHNLSLQLRVGMHEDHVINILGYPLYIYMNAEHEQWIYWNHIWFGYIELDYEKLAMDQLVVTFENGKVIEWSRETESNEISKAALQQGKQSKNPMEIE